jgi:hypothetical protein
MSIKEAALRTVVLKAISDALKAETDADKAELFGALVDLYEDTGSKTLDVKLPDGTKVATISLVIEASAPEVFDRAALMAWAAENRSEWCNEIPARVEVSEKAALEGVEFTPEGIAVTPGGEVVPGIRMRRGGTPKHTSVKFQPAGRSAIAAAWSDGVFGTALPGMAPALTDGDRS